MTAEEEWMKVRSQMGAEIGHELGSIACEHVFYGEGTSGVYMDLRMATAMATSMVGTIGMGPDKLDERMSRRAANIGEQLISVAEITQGMHEQGTWAGAVLNNRRSRRGVAQILAAACVPGGGPRPRTAPASRGGAHHRRRARHGPGHRRPQRPRSAAAVRPRGNPPQRARHGPRGLRVSGRGTPGRAARL